MCKALPSQVMETFWRYELQNGGIQFYWIIDNNIKIWYDFTRKNTLFTSHQEKKKEPNLSSNNEAFLWKITPFFKLWAEAATQRVRALKTALTAFFQALFRSQSCDSVFLGTKLP